MNEFYMSLVAIGKDGRFIDIRERFGSCNDFKYFVKEFASDVQILNDDLKLIKLYAFGYGLVSDYTYFYDDDDLVKTGN